jgi:hypothetical protein
MKLSVRGAILACALSSAQDADPPPDDILVDFRPAGKGTLPMAMAHGHRIPAGKETFISSTGLTGIAVTSSGTGSTAAARAGGGSSVLTVLVPDRDQPLSRSIRAARHGARLLVLVRRQRYYRYVGACTPGWRTVPLQ